MLEFYSIESPLAQPRNVVIGQLISVATGISIARIFLLSGRFDEIQWVAGALACASATALMALTKTVHPPAGATALLAVVDREMLEMGWLLIPVVLLSCLLMLCIALILNNIERQFPIYWWTPECRTRKGPVFLRRTSGQTMEDGEGGSERRASCTRENGESGRNGDTTLESGETTDVETNPPVSRAVAYVQANEVIIKHGQVIVPEHMFITQEEELLLESMCYRV